MRKILSTATAILTFAAVMSLLTATARGAADPPPLLVPDPPRLEKRVSDLERRVKELESSLAAKPKACPCGDSCGCPAGACPSGCPAISADRFTATDGVTYARGADGHYRAVSAPAAVPAATPTARSPSGHTHTCRNGHTWDHATHAGHDCPVCGQSQYVQDSFPRPVTVGALASAPRTYSLPSGGCANGNCSTGLRPESLFQSAQKRFTFPTK